MDLQTQVKLKNSLLMVRRDALSECIALNIARNNTQGILLTFVIAPFVAGLIWRRLRLLMSSVWYVKQVYRIFPLTPFFKNN
jgi:hypothetical protein